MAKCDSLWDIIMVQHMKINHLEDKGKRPLTEWRKKTT